MLRIPDHESLPNLVTDTHWNHSNICAQLQDSNQMCMNTMHAKVSMLISRHQLMVKYDADHISPSSAASDSYTSLVTKVNRKKVQHLLVQNSNTGSTG